MAEPVKPKETEHRGLESVRKVAEIPVVECAINKVSEAYSNLKDFSEPVNYLLTSAEIAASRTAHSIQPITAKLEGPVKTIDTVLSRGIDYVEEKIPAIKFTPEEISIKTKGAFNTNVVEPVKKGMTAVKEYSKQTVTYFVSESKTPNGTEAKK